MPGRARTRGAMKITTVRSSVDLWRLLEVEAAVAGVSVSQYIREAALARAAAAAAARGEDPLLLLGGSTARSAPRRTKSTAAGRAAAARQKAAETLTDASATTEA
jgi:hypothetical protein